MASSSSSFALSKAIASGLPKDIIGYISDEIISRGQQLPRLPESDKVHEAILSRFNAFFESERSHTLAISGRGPPIYKRTVNKRSIISNALWLNHQRVKQLSMKHMETIRNINSLTQSGNVDVKQMIGILLEDYERDVARHPSIGYYCPILEMKNVDSGIRIVGRIPFRWRQLNIPNEDILTIVNNNIPRLIDILNEGRSSKWEYLLHYFDRQPSIVSLSSQSSQSSQSQALSSSLPPPSDDWEKDVTESLGDEFILSSKEEQEHEPQLPPQPQSSPLSTVIYNGTLNNPNSKSFNLLNQWSGSAVRNKDGGSEYDNRRITNFEGNPYRMIFGFRYVQEKPGEIALSKWSKIRLGIRAVQDYDDSPSIGKYEPITNSTPSGEMDWTKHYILCPMVQDQRFRFGLFGFIDDKEIEPIGISRITDFSQKEGKYQASLRDINGNPIGSIHYGIKNVFVQVRQKSASGAIICKKKPGFDLRIEIAEQSAITVGNIQIPIGYKVTNTLVQNIENFISFGNHGINYEPVMIIVGQGMTNNDNDDHILATLSTLNASIDISPRFNSKFGIESFKWIPDIAIAAAKKETKLLSQPSADISASSPLLPSTALGKIIPKADDDSNLLRRSMITNHNIKHFNGIDSFIAISPKALNERKLGNDFNGHKICLAIATKMGQFEAITGAFEYSNDALEFVYGDRFIEGPISADNEQIRIGLFDISNVAKPIILALSELLIISKLINEKETIKLFRIGSKELIMSIILQHTTQKIQRRKASLIGRLLITYANDDLKPSITIKRLRTRMIGSLSVPSNPIETKINGESIDIEFGADEYQPVEINIDVPNINDPSKVTPYTGFCVLSISEEPIDILFNAFTYVRSHLTITSFKFQSIMTSSPSSVSSSSSSTTTTTTTESTTSTVIAQIMT